jgi:lipoyl-dependent peroxiredoxin subunit C
MYSVGDKFPDFSMKGVNDTNNFVDVDILLKEWTVMYFYPKDFTFICPTEIKDMDYLVNDADIIGVSGDNEYCKRAWKEQNDDIRNIQHVLCADSGLKLGRTLGIVDEENGVHYRATYIIDPDGIIQHVSVNALDTGRSANEILRTLQALQAGGLTGCSWQPGEDFVA